MQAHAPRFRNVVIGVACANTGRKFIGCEIDSGIYATAKARIAAAQRDRAELLIA